jgi:peptidyl-dipeptidase Dcp
MDSNLSQEMDNNLLYFSDVAELAGVPQAAIDRAKERAKKKDRDGEYALTLIGEEVRDFLRFAQNRSVRERVFNSYVSRGARDDQYDNRALLAEIITLRQEQATLLGFATYAHLSTADKMAQTPEPVMELLQDIWSPALAKYKLEREVLQQAAHDDGMNDSLHAWDWSYYAEKVRQRDYALNENEIRDYLQIDNVIQGVFDSAEKLLGIKMVKRPDLETYHPDATPYEVQGKNGEHIGIFGQTPMPAKANALAHG